MSEPQGWFQIAYERELTSEATTVSIAQRRLLIVRTDAGHQVYDAACPHRGANLGLGKLVADGLIRCSFHGYRVGLGVCGDHGLRAREYPSLMIGGLLFARLSSGHDRGFVEFMHELDRTHYVVPGFLLTTRAPPSTVIENAFDESHFEPVHAVLEAPHLRTSLSSARALVAEGTFTLPASRWQRSDGERVEVPYRAVAFSPGVVVSEMGGSHPYIVITCATERAGGDTAVRVSVAVPAEGGDKPDDAQCAYLLAQSKKGLERDREIWDTSDIGPATQLRADASVRDFQAFAAGFSDPESV